ncbi:MAG: HDOD domain-containing protein [Motiliproteus sp.]|nr:HDOD domain-containing protein [Motiliproteus sp.]MCW9053989.1 HDOD domain-containing protein [Motiliproteus sp.]
MDQQQIERLKKSINKVMPFSNSVQAAFKKMNEKPIDIDAICQLLEMDPLLAAAILRLANSPFYGFVRKIDLIHDAAVLLGIHSLRQVIVSYSMVQAFPHTSSSGLDRSMAWKHAIAVAVTARYLSKAAGHEDNEAFIAGMLHDIGQFLLDQCFEEEYRQVFEYQREHQCSLSKAEFNILKLGHGKVGAVAIRHWKLPDHLAEVALRHDHPPADGEVLPLIDLIHIANVLVKGLCIVPEDQEPIGTICDASLERLGLSWQQVEPLFPEIEQMSHEMIDRMMQ